MWLPDIPTVHNFTCAVHSLYCVKITHRVADGAISHRFWLRLVVAVWRIANLLKSSSAPVYSQYITNIFTIYSFYNSNTFPIGSYYIPNMIQLYFQYISHRIEPSDKLSTCCKSVQKRTKEHWYWYLISIFQKDIWEMQNDTMRVVGRNRRMLGRCEYMIFIFDIHISEMHEAKCHNESCGLE